MKVINMWYLHDILSDIYYKSRFNNSSLIYAWVESKKGTSLWIQVLPSHLKNLERTKSSEIYSAAYQ
jgi:hypothetical protein